MAVFSCIYCPAQQPVPYHKEHVIPQAFGRFRPDIYIRSVCPLCNEHFGRELDWFLNRDSGEALIRSRCQPRLASKAGHLKSKRVKMTINAPGPWMGARVYLLPDAISGTLRTELIPQIAFRKKGEDNWIWFTVKELRAASAETLQGYTKNSEMRIIGPSKASCDYLRNRLAQLQIPFKEQGKLDDPMTDNGEIEVCVEYAIDQTILRAVAKIAFNYLAYVHGADMASRDDFDAIRNFIRHGHKPSWEPVTPRAARILAEETGGVRCTNGHLLTIEWDPTGDGIIARVSLFNDITYAVRLCRWFWGVWRDIRAGHHFDINTGEVSPLQSISSHLIPTIPFIRGLGPFA